MEREKQSKFVPSKDKMGNKKPFVEKERKGLARGTSILADSKVSLDDGRVSAVSFGSGGLGYVLDSNLEVGGTTLYPHFYSCSTFGVNITNLSSDFELTKGANFTAAVTEAAASYYGDSITATEFQNIYNGAKAVIEESLSMLAYLVCLKKYQDLRNITDKRGIDLGPLLAHINTPTVAAAPTIVDETAQLGNMSINNAKWMEFINYVKQGYYSEKLIRTFEYLFGHNFKLQRDDATIRFVTFVPERDTPGELYFNTLANIEARFVAMAASVVALLGQYPVISKILENLGMTKGFGIDHDFTRDLSGKSYNLIEDKEGIIEAICYQCAEYDAMENYNITSKDGIVSVPTDVSIVGDELDWHDRISVDVISLANILRGGILQAYDCAVISVGEGTDSGAFTYYTRSYYPVYIEIPQAKVSSFSKDELYYIGLTNRMLGIVDGCVPVYQLTRKADDTWGTIVQPGIGDYYMNAGDIQIVHSLSVSDMFFGGNIDKYIRTDSTVNTLNVKLM